MTSRPQSPVLANLFLHYALDRWLTVHHKDIPFCRYADDGILHCRSEAEAHYLRERLAARLRDGGLEMHPTKTRVVYCKDRKRTETHEHIQFDFLGYIFRPRRTVSRNGRPLLGFTPAVSRQPVADHLDRAIIRWAMRKHKRLRGRKMRAISWLASVKRKRPTLFVHWSGRGAFSVGAMGAR